MKPIRKINLFSTAVNKKRSCYFRCRDKYSLSDKRLCLKLGKGEYAEFSFKLSENEIENGTYEICFAGSLELFDSHAYVHRFINSTVLLKLNGTTIYDGLIHWRSHEETASYWPIFDFQFDASLLKVGENTIKFANTTSIKKLGEFFDPRISEELGKKEAGEKIATLYLSDIEINFVHSPRKYPRISGVPGTAVEGVPFIIEVSSRQEKKSVELKSSENASVKPLGTAFEMGEYKHLFRVVPLSAGKVCKVNFICDEAVLTAEVGTVYSNSGNMEELITGPGVETTYWHQLLPGIEDFFAMGTGNCIRISIDDFLNNLHHIPTPQWIPLIKYLVRRERYFALQRIRVPHYSKIQHKDLKKLADMGGKLFAGVSIAEPVLFFAHDPAGKQEDLGKRIDAYKKYFRKRLEEVRLPGHKVVTFDSSGGMCGHYYQLGLDVQISEIAPACNILEESCSRGAASAFGKQWGVATAMHWYSGQGAQYAYDDARVCYAWLVMFHSYLAGARQILWEGGMFDNLPVYNFILSEESWRDFGRRYDHPMLVKAREGFRKLLDFHRAQQLSSPTVEFGVIRGINDMPISYSDSTSRYGDMSMARSWALLKVFLPHFCQGGRLESGRNIRRWYSATPYGQVDIVPAEADKKAFSKYKMLSLLGWNTMTKELYGKLVDYVRNGGTLFVSTAHFTVDTFQKLEWNFINKGDLSELCGVHVRDLGDRIESVKFTAEDFKQRFPDSFVLSRKNPLFVSHFDELYPVFERDVTYFGGDL